MEIFGSLDNASVVRVVSEICFSVFCVYSIIVSAVLKKGKRASDRYLIHSIFFCLFYMLSDIMAVYYRGVNTSLGIAMTRIGNFLYFISGLLAIYFLGEYLAALLKEEGYPDGVPLFRRLNASIMILEVFLLVINGFSGIIYSFTGDNLYVRGELYMIFSVLTYVAFLNFFVFCVSRRKLLTKLKFIELISCCLVPAIAFIIQNMFYGLFIANIAVCGCINIVVLSVMMEQNQLSIRREKEITEARLDLMVSQIQPHFIFNSLTAIQSLVLENPQEAFDAIGDFADFIRGALKALNNKDMIPLEEDLKTAEGYINIEKKRFGDKLKVVEDIQDKNFYVPALTIQPIVENAIRHGIRGREKSGTVSLFVYGQQDNHVIEVRDDGVGFYTKEYEGSVQGHVGIQNVRTRLKYFCDGRMEIISAPNEGTVVRMYFPKDSKRG